MNRISSTDSISPAELRMQQKDCSKKFKQLLNSFMCSKNLFMLKNINNTNCPYTVISLSYYQQLGLNGCGGTGTKICLVSTPIGYVSQSAQSQQETRQPIENHIYSQKFSTIIKNVFDNVCISPQRSQEGKKTLNSVYGHEEILQYCAKRNFLVELGLPVFES